MRRVSQLVALAAVLGCIEATPLGSEIFSSNYSIKFLLYTLENPSTPQELMDSPGIFIHGWTKSPEEIPNPQLRSAYNSRGDYNLISVDWEEIASLDYASARYLVSFVGAKLAAFIDFLNQDAGMSFESVVVIGHSLGAHCAGYAGKLVTRGRLPYIVGLDPAAPLVFYSDPDTRLCSTDADYVMTIQTNAGLKGMAGPVGGAAFFANGGTIQPGCGADFEGNCAHARCVFYYANAVSGLKFAPISKCPSFLNTPIYTEHNCSAVVPNLDIDDPTAMLQSNGIFDFTTNAQEPFGHF